MPLLEGKCYEMRLNNKEYIYIHIIYHLLILFLGSVSYIYKPIRKGVRGGFTSQDFVCLFVVLSWPEYSSR